MSLRDEIEKLIDARRRDLERLEAFGKAVDERQRERFSLLRPFLNELAAAFEPEELEVQIGGDHALITVGNSKFEIGVGDGDEYYFLQEDGPVALRSESVQEITQHLSQIVAQEIANDRHSSSRWLESD